MRFLLLLLTTNLFALNPFAISFFEKKEMSHDDYEMLQIRLREIPLEPIENLVSSLPNRPYAMGRCSVGKKLGLIDRMRGLFPVQKLQKIGRGGSRCIVSYASYNRKYPELLSDIPKALEELGFDGYFYYRIGGFPNPTGQEIRFAGVPYSFKIFMMQEAEQLGFDTVLWLDTALYPLKNPAPLFKAIEEKGYVLHGWKVPPEDNFKMHTQTARETLWMYTGIDIMYATYIQANVFGLKMNTPSARKIIDSFKFCLELGTPFLSCLPEEGVLAALIAWHTPEWKPFHERIRVDGNGTTEDIQRARKGQQAYFYLRPH